MPILDDKGLRDETPGEIRRRAANAEHLRGEALVIGRVAHFGEPREQPIAKHGYFAGRSRPKPARSCGDSEIGSRPPIDASPAIARTAARSAES